MRADVPALDRLDLHGAYLRQDVERERTLVRLALACAPRLAPARLAVAQPFVGEVADGRREPALPLLGARLAPLLGRILAERDPADQPPRLVARLITCQIADTRDLQADRAS